MPLLVSAGEGQSQCPPTHPPSPHPPVLQAKGYVYEQRCPHCCGTGLIRGRETRRGRDVRRGRLSTCIFCTGLGKQGGGAGRTCH